jgi:hypothetical protein
MHPGLVDLLNQPKPSRIWCEAEDDMPKGSKVDRIYQALRREGKSATSAARIAQARSGQSLKTDRKPKKD